MAESNLRHDFFQAHTPSVHWLAGLIAADGYVTPDLRRWRLSQSGDHGRALVQNVRGLINHQATLSTHQPPRGKPAHSITVGSPTMITDLAKRYGITPRKTLTYRWPGLTGDAAAAFLRGYIDGDGCVSTYPTPQGEPFLHISFVGTNAFVQEASNVIPAAGRIRRIERCADLAEVRYSGRHAWSAGTWLYAEPTLVSTKKAAAYSSYAVSLETEPPLWYVNLHRREEALSRLRGGMSLRDAAKATGVRAGTIWRWKRAHLDTVQGEIA